MKIALAVVFVAVVGVIVWQASQQREPVYEGRTLSAWIKAYPDVFVFMRTKGLPSFQYGTGLNEVAQRNAEAAVRQAGTNAIPVFLRMLRASDSPLKVKLVALAARQHVIKIQYTPAWAWNSTGFWGFSVLGTNGQSAVPTLMRIADENISPESESCAISALGYVGPSAKEAVPSFLRWATNANVQVRYTAIDTLYRIDPEAAKAAMRQKPSTAQGTAHGASIPEPPKEKP